MPLCKLLPVHFHWLDRPFRQAWVYGGVGGSVHGYSPGSVHSKMLAQPCSLVAFMRLLVSCQCMGTPQDLRYRHFTAQISDTPACFCSVVLSWLQMQADGLNAVVQAIHWAAPWLAWLLLTFGATAPVWAPWMYPAILLEPLVSATMRLPGSMKPLCQTPGTSSTTRSLLLLQCYDYRLFKSTQQACIHSFLLHIITTKHCIVECRTACMLR